MGKQLRNFKLELKYESIDRTEEIPLGEQIISVPRQGNSLKELELAYVEVEKILGDRGGYNHGDLTTIIIWSMNDEPMGIASLNQNEETCEAYPLINEWDLIWAWCFTRARELYSKQLAIAVK